MGHWSAFYTDEFMREHHAMLEALRREDADGFFAARRAVVATANAHQAMCPHCGQPMPGSTPAADAPKDASGDRGVAPAPDANIANEPKPSGYMSRPKML